MSSVCFVPFFPADKHGKTQAHIVTCEDGNDNLFLFLLSGPVSTIVAPSSPASSKLPRIVNKWSKMLQVLQKVSCDTNCDFSSLAPHQNCAFMAPKLWNSLPLDTFFFKKQLKPHLFRYTLILNVFIFMVSLSS